MPSQAAFTFRHLADAETFKLGQWKQSKSTKEFKQIYASSHLYKSMPAYGVQNFYFILTEQEK